MLSLNVTVSQFGQEGQWGNLTYSFNLSMVRLRGDFARPPLKDT
jgi:hypothetical protein